MVSYASSEQFNLTSFKAELTKLNYTSSVNLLLIKDSSSPPLKVLLILLMLESMCSISILPKESFK